MSRESVSGAAQAGGKERTGGRGRLRRIGILVFWLCLWQAVSSLVANDIFLVGPMEVASALARRLPTREFWMAIAHSFGRISLGFLGAFILGIGFGAAAYRCGFLRELLEPPMALVKSIPVASFVILALIWAGSRNLSVLIAFLVVMPMIYVGTVAGLESTDGKLLEMAHVFRVGLFRRIRYLYIPALYPYLASSCRSALGMSWKSGVAAEVIGVPEGSLGERLYMAKVSLDTAELFAWTLVIVLVSAQFERLFLWLLEWMRPERRGCPACLSDGAGTWEKPSRPVGGDAVGRMVVRGLTKSFDGRQVISGMSFDFKAGVPCFLMGPSGVGKSTLFGILAGLILPDAGGVHGEGMGKPPRFGVVFQEDRLCGTLSALANVSLAVGDGYPRQAVYGELKRLIPEEAITRPVSTLSGGQKRRVAICRAVLAPSDVLLMDEPFSGLDGGTKRDVMRYVLERAQGKPLLIATHHEEEARRMGGQIIRMGDWPGKGALCPTE